MKKKSFYLMITIMTTMMLFTLMFVIIYDIGEQGFTFVNMLGVVVSAVVFGVVMFGFEMLKKIKDSQEDKGK